MQLAANAVQRLNDITVKHAVSMPKSTMVAKGYGEDKPLVFRQLAEVNSTYGSGVSRPRQQAAAQLPAMEATLPCATLS